MWYINRIVLEDRLSVRGMLNKILENLITEVIRWEIMIMIYNLRSYILSCYAHAGSWDDHIICWRSSADNRRWSHILSNESSSSGIKMIIYMSWCLRRDLTIYSSGLSSPGVRVHLHTLRYGHGYIYHVFF